MRLNRAVGWTLGTLGAGLLAFYWWQPWEYTVIARAERYPTATEPPFDPSDLFRSGVRVLLVIAHPDDEAFFLGATLTQLGRAGAEVKMVTTTDGDKGYYPFEDHVKNRKVRREELRESARTFGGVGVTFLGFPDGRVKNSAFLRSSLRREIERYRPEFVLTFDPDVPQQPSHADHRRTGEATMQVLAEMGWQGTALLFQTLRSSWQNDVTDDWPSKVALLKVHESQFGQEMKFIEGLVRGTSEAEGRKIGRPLAEAFRVVRMGG